MSLHVLIAFHQWVHGNKYFHLKPRQSVKIMTELLWPQYHHTDITEQLYRANYSSKLSTVIYNPGYSYTSSTMISVLLNVSMVRRLQGGIRLWNYCKAVCHKMNEDCWDFMCAPLLWTFGIPRFHPATCWHTLRTVSKTVCLGLHAHARPAPTTDDPAIYVSASSSYESQRAGHRLAWSCLVDRWASIAGYPAGYTAV
jgi:hypothetical protein